MGGTVVGDSGGALSYPADDLPSVEALEAAQEKERREAKNLLEAFDRSARGAKRPAPSGGPGFVEYYASKASAARERGPERRVTPRRAAAVATVVRPPLPRRTGVPAWLFWGIASASMIGVGATAAILTTGDPAPATARATPFVVHPTVAPIAPIAPGSARDEVPLPDPLADPAPAATPAAAEGPTAAPPRSFSRAPASGSAPPRRPVHEATPAPLPRATDDGPVRQL